MVFQHHVTVDLEHRLLGLGERRPVNEDTVPVPSGVAMAREEGLAKGTNIMYANTINGVLEYNLMYSLYNKKSMISKIFTARRSTGIIS